MTDDNSLGAAAYTYCSRNVRRACRAANRGLQRVFPSLKEVPTPYEQLARHPLAEIAVRQQIDLILDIGANVGQTGRNLRTSGYRGRIVSFEPQRNPFAQLCEVCRHDDKWECLQIALGRDSGWSEMEVSAWDACSSLLSMDSRHLEMWPESKPIGTERVRREKLDNLVDELKIKNHRTMLKIDVQGYELEVLAGASNVLELILAAQLELLFSPLYKGQAPYYEVVSRMETAGLRFVGLFGTCQDTTTGYLLFGDGLFVR
jgi:FkbM family methyltransferase